MRDFTLSMYRELLTALVQAGYTFCSFSEWCREQPSGRVVIMRHDVDRKPANALRMAHIEHMLGVRSTYYFRMNPSVFKSAIISEIAALGHELGYHYRDLVDARGDISRASEAFQVNLERLRAVVHVDTASMDGCPWSRYDNRDLWRSYDYHDFGIIGEPYFDFLSRGDEVVYLTDTARMWNGDKYNVRDKRMGGGDNLFSDIHSTSDLIEWIKTSDNQRPVMLTTHPQRWTDSFPQWVWELVSQSAKNKIKRCITGK